jgi:hypothetical protein
MNKKELAKYLDWLKIVIFVCLAVYIFYLGERYHGLTANQSLSIAGVLAIYALYKIIWTHIISRRYSS